MIAILGGSFDPIHNGHLYIARHVYEHLQPDELRFLPCHQHIAHKTLSASSEERHAMLLLALKDQRGFTLDFRELVSPTPSYTIDTLTAIRQEIGQDYPVAFIIGSDIVPTLAQWQRWQELLDFTHFIIIQRPDFLEDQFGPMTTYIQKQTVTDPNLLKTQAHGLIYRLNTPPISISSSQVRNCVVHQQPIDNLVPPTVAEYIKTHDLYR